MTVLNFNGYKVLHCEYIRNDIFDNSQSEIDMDHKLKANTNIDIDNNTSEIEISVSVGSIEKTNQPFKVEVSLIGSFSYEINEDENSIGFENLLKVNGTAILYPYLRALVASITNLSGEYPGYNMPTLNIKKALEIEEP